MKSRKNLKFRKSAGNSYLLYLTLSAENGIVSIKESASADIMLGFQGHGKHGLILKHKREN
jgi:hypothetical protein